MLHNLVGKEQIRQLAFGGSFVGNRLHFYRALNDEVSILLYHAIEQRLELALREGRLLPLQQYPVFLTAEYTLGCFTVGRRNQYLKKQLVDFGCRLLIYFAVADDHATKCRYGIASECILPRSRQIRSGGHATGVCMFQYGKCRLPELV